MTIGPFALNMVPLASRCSLILFTKKRDYKYRFHRLLTGEQIIGVLAEASTVID